MKLRWARMRKWGLGMLFISTPECNDFNHDNLSSLKKALSHYDVIKRLIEFGHTLEAKYDNKVNPKYAE
jgi:hypothetical protein